MTISKDEQKERKRLIKEEKEGIKKLKRDQKEDDKIVKKLDNLKFPKGSK